MTSVEYKLPAAEDISTSRKNRKPMQKMSISWFTDCILSDDCDPVFLYIWVWIQIHNFFYSSPNYALNTIIEFTDTKWSVK